MLDRRFTFWLLLLPPLLWLLAFFLVPILVMGAFSFREDSHGLLFSAWDVGLKQYLSVANTPSFMRLLGLSALVALAVSLIVVALAYPLAYFLAIYARRRLGFYLVLLLVPFWTSYLLRVMALKLMLGTSGAANSFLMYLGLIQEPLAALLYNRTAVMLTLMYVWTPFAALPILAALQRIDLAIFEAASDLGARPWRQFLRITLPLSMPGVLAAFFMVFIPTVGEYVTPLLVGGSSGLLYGNIIQDFFTKAANWPLGSALSMIMLACTLLLLLVASRLIDLREFLQ